LIQVTVDGHFADVKILSQLIDLDRPVLDNHLKDLRAAFLAL
jgi:hypothetical protein